MWSGIFQSTTIPVLEEVVHFTEARHTVLAGNIANLDTPGYQVRDLSAEDFQSRLKAALQERQSTPEASSPGNPAPKHGTALAEVSKNPKTILRHDKANVGMEYQVSEMVKNQVQHNTALSLLVSQFRLLQTAISGRV